jgi:protease I
MMELKGKRIAVLAEDQFEDLELWYPLLRMREAGAEVLVVGTGSAERYTGKNGLSVAVDVSADAASSADFDAVIVPGGYAPDRMRRYPALLDFVRSIHDAGGIVAMICHAGWVPISAGIVSGRKVTSVPAIKDDLVNAGAHWADQAVVRDGNLISSRSPDDLSFFCPAIIAALTTA